MHAALAFILSCGLLATLAGAQDVERRFERSFPAPAEAVALRLSRGTVTVRGAAAGADLRFEVVLRLQRPDPEEKPSVMKRLTPDLLAPLKRDAEGAFASLAPRFEASAERVELTLRDSREVVLDSDPALQMVIDVRVWVPAGVNLELRSVAAGLVVVEHFPGSIDLRGESGSYFAQSVGGDFSARTRGGRITVGEVRGRTSLHTGSGDIVSGRLRGPAKIVTANGSVEVLQAYDSLQVRAADADLHLGLARPLPRGIDLFTSAGRITVRIDRDLPFTVDASTRLLGKVSSRGLEPVLRRGAFNQSSLLADFNGGGERVLLRTRWGRIQLIGREPLAERGGADGPDRASALVTPP